MKKNQVMGIIRAVLAALGGTVSTSGYINDVDWAEVSGAIVVIITALWSIFEKRKSSLPPASVVLGFILIGGSLMCSGCASMLAVSSHDSNVNTRAKVLHAQPLGNNGVGVGVDLLGLNTGYFSAWKDQPGMMAGATGLDLITTLGALFMIQKSQESEKSGGAVTITGNGNQVTTGDQSPATDSETTTTSGGE